MLVPSCMLLRHRDQQQAVQRPCPTWPVRIDGGLWSAARIRNLPCMWSGQSS